MAFSSSLTKGEKITLAMLTYCENFTTDGINQEIDIGENYDPDSTTICFFGDLLCGLKDSLKQVENIDFDRAFVLQSANDFFRCIADSLSA